MRISVGEVGASAELGDAVSGPHSILRHARGDHASTLVVADTCKVATSPFNNWSRCDCTHIVPRSRSSVDKSLRAGTEGNSAMRSWQSNKQLKIWVPHITVEVALKKAALLVKSKSVAPLGQIALV